VLLPALLLLLLLPRLVPMLLLVAVLNAHAALCAVVSDV
jgi:hypothetical protein